MELSTPLQVLVLVVFFVPGYIFASRMEGALPFKAPTTEAEHIVKFLAATVLFYAPLALVYALVQLLLGVDLYDRVASAAALKPARWAAIGILAQLGLFYAAFKLGPKVGGYLWRRDSANTLAAFPVLFRVAIPGILPSLAGGKDGDQIVFVRASMGDDRMYSGQLKYIPADFDVLNGENRDIYLVDAWEHDGKDGWQRVSDDGIFLNTRDIKDLRVRVLPRA